ncbi:MAG: hypothetical protein ACRDKB_14055 [Actinomycetota bacterium]
MKRILLIGGLVGALFAGTPASAVVLLTDGSVTGGGFNRVDGPGPGYSDATKRMVTIEATDSDPMGDSGTANWRIHTPRPSQSSPSNLKARITLACVFVSDDVAYATGSGGGVDYSLRIRDGGEPGKGQDSFGVVEDTGLDALLCMAESEVARVALEVLWASRTKYTLDGGNFQITSSN